MHSYFTRLNRATPAAAAWLLGAAVVLVGPACLAAGGSGAGVAQRRIFLDPDTGKVIEPAPDAARRQSEQARRPDKNTRRSAPGRARQGARAWKTDEGVQMLTPAPSDMPETRVVRCPDGSLHMGAHREHAATGHDRSARAAVCNGSHTPSPDTDVGRED